MALDLQLFSLLHGFAGQSKLVDSVIIFCADYLAYLLVLAFIVFLYVTQHQWRTKIELFLVAAIAALIARGVLTEIIRYFYHRPRPFVALEFTPLFQDTAWSFPSGHSTFFYALSTVVYLYDKRWGTAFFLFTITMTFARVAAGVHYPSDILGGAVIGLGSGLFSWWAVRTYLSPKPNQTY